MTKTHDVGASEPSDLSLSTEKICFIIFKAQAFDGKVAAPVSDPGSNPSDDHDWSVLADYKDDPVLEELMSLISSLNVDEQVDLVALMWIGRGDYTAEDWASLREEAASARNERTASYLCGTPMLGDHLANGMELFGLSCADYEMEHL